MPRKSSKRLDERRGASRRRVLYPATLVFMRRRFSCKLIEIADDGACIAGGPTLKAGTPVIVESMISGSRAAVVAHCSGAKLGLAFLASQIRIRHGMVELATDGD